MSRTWTVLLGAEHGLAHLKQIDPSPTHHPKARLSQFCPNCIDFLITRLQSQFSISPIHNYPNSPFLNSPFLNISSTQIEVKHFSISQLYRFAPILHFSTRDSVPASITQFCNLRQLKISSKGNRCYLYENLSVFSIIFSIF